MKVQDLLDVMNRLKRLLKPDGVLYASFKEGNTEREKDGRFFHDMTEDACQKLFLDAGMEVLDIFRSQDVREGHIGEFWVNIIGIKG